MSESLSYNERTHILVVDDDARIRSLIKRYLTQSGFMVACAKDAQDTRALLENCAFDALVIDVMMPGEDGVSLTSSLKEKNDTPILLLTALGESDDRIKGLESGADDYLVKPFEPKELALRLKSLTRRIQRPVRSKQNQKYQIGQWLYDPQYATLIKGDAEELSLTSGENTLLKVLAQNHGQILSRDQLAKLCDIETGDRTIDVQITRLRRKIEADVKSPKSVQTIRGQGYVLNAEPAEKEE